MNDRVHVISYAAPPIDRAQALRYAGAVAGNADIELLLDSCIEECGEGFEYKVCWCEFPIAVDEHGVDMGFSHISSADLARNLKGCGSAVVFGATVGIISDRMVARYSSVSPSRALMMQALGAERIERLCDIFCEEIERRKAEDGFDVRPRFSPGYGDLSIELQKDIFAVLDCPRKIGLSLNQSLLMSPTKSVTAIIGIRKTGE